MEQDTDHQAQTAFLVLAASVAIAVIALFLDRNTNLRFEAEVVVNTPSGPKSGSGVYNMRYKYAPLDHWIIGSLDHWIIGFFPILLMDVVQPSLEKLLALKCFRERFSLF